MKDELRELRRWIQDSGRLIQRGPCLDKIDQLLAASEPATEESSAPQSDTESMASLLRCIAEDFCDQGKYKRLAVAILKHARAIAREEIAAAKLEARAGDKWVPAGGVRISLGDS